MPSAVSNFFIKAIVNSPLHPILGGAFAVITVQGRKTGKRYSTPINVRREGNDFTTVSLRNRTWWRNLRGGAPAELRVSGKRLAVRGEVIEGRDEVLEGLAAYSRRYPEHARFFGVRLGGDGEPDRQGLERAASMRVILRFRPDPAYNLPGGRTHTFEEARDGRSRHADE